MEHIDSLGTSLEINDWVAFYQAAHGKTLFGKVINFNTNSIVIKLKGKIATVRKISTQVVKVPAELCEDTKNIIMDALGIELKIGDFVTTVGRNHSIGHDSYNGKIVVGEVKSIKQSSILLRIINKKSAIRKKPCQVVKISSEQAMLKMFIEG